MNITITLTPRSILFFTLSCLTIGGIMAFRNPAKNLKPAQASIAVVDSAYGLQLTLAEFNTAKTNWQNTHPAGAIRGGSISRGALMEVINSMPPENSSVSLYFGSDKSGRTYIMFAPSGANGESKIYRNASFCPNLCN